MSKAFDGVYIPYILKVGQSRMKEVEAAGFPEKWWKLRKEENRRDSKVSEGMECRHDKSHRCAQCEADEREANRYLWTKDEGIRQANATYAEFSQTNPLPLQVTDYITALELALERLR